MDVAIEMFKVPVKINLYNKLDERFVVTDV